MAEKPLMLKDYLELESITESFRWASTQRAVPVRGSGTTIRRLLETDLGCDDAGYSGWSLVRFRSKGVLLKLSAVIRILQFCTDEARSPAVDGDSGASPILSRSLSKKLRRGFWKKNGHEKEEGKVMVKDIVRFKPFNDEEVDNGYLYSSPGISKCSSSSDFLSSSDSSDLFVDSNDKSKPRSPKSRLSQSPTLIPDKGIFVDCVGDDNRREQKGLCDKDMDCPSEEEKEQLSPVSVLDFPYQDEDEDGEVEQPSATSPCFEHRTGNIGRKKNQLLQKIRRMESLSKLDSVELDHLFPYTETHGLSAVDLEMKEERWQRTACHLLRRVGKSLTDCEEKLLLEFFVENHSVNEECRLGVMAGRDGDEELLRVATAWFAGKRIMDEAEGELRVTEWEMGSGGWRQFEEEEEIVAVEITGGLLAWLIAELVADLGPTA